MGCEVCKRKRLTQLSSQEYDAAPINQNFTDFVQEKQPETVTNDIDTTIQSEEFDEVKAKELVKYLLSRDIKFYKNQLYDVINLNSEEFRRLFDGDSDYIYNVKNQDNFKKLALKFENFSILLYEWYQNDKVYYECLQQLWRNFINLYDLKDLDERELEKKLRDTDYQNWDKKIKKEFKIVIKGSSDLSEKFKIFIKNEYKELDDVIKALQKTKKTMEKEEKEEKKSYNFCIKENLNMITDKLIENLFPVFFEETIHNNIKDDIIDNKIDDKKDNKIDDKKDNKIDDKKDNKENDIQNQKEDKVKEIKLTKNQISQLVKKVAKLYVKGEIPEDFDMNKTLEEIGNYAHQFGSIKLLQPKLEQIQNIINNKLIGYGILGLSFLNLCYNIASTHSFIENSKTKIDELNQKLADIKTDFNKNKK